MDLEIKTKINNNNKKNTHKAYGKYKNNQRIFKKKTPFTF